jgi:hypothetical protein
VTQPTPFIVFALPRSRTAWLSVFLSYGPWSVYHEQSVLMRSLEDIRRFLARRNVGTVETGAAPAWPLIEAVCPGIRRAAVRRPLEESIASCMALNATLPRHRHYDPDVICRHLSHFNRNLDRIAKQPGVLSIDFAELATEPGCARIFEHCLEQPMPRSWWEYWRNRNIQMDVAQHLNYFDTFRPEIDRLKRDLKRDLRALVRARRERTASPQDAPLERVA